MIDRTTVKLAFISWFLVSILSANAAAQDQERSGWQFGITPRLWVSALTIPDEDNVSSGAVFIPLYGGTVSVSPGFAPNVTLLVTGLRGNGSGDIVFNPGGFVPGGCARCAGTQNVARTDFEALLRYSFANGINVSAGGRYVKFVSDVSAQTVYLGPDTGARFSNHAENTILLGEIAVGFVHEVSQDGRHRVFGNLIGAFGSIKNKFQDSLGTNQSSSSPTVGMDVNVGYEYWFTPYTNIGLRYRSFVLAANNDYDLVKFFSIHGPEFFMGVMF